MQNQKKQFGLIGFPLGHSFSKGHFSRKFEQESLLGYTYENFEIPSISQIGNIISENPDLMGLNVTIPYKREIIPYLEELDPVARKIGAVNTIKIDRSGSQPRLYGYNTDVTGFTTSLADWPLNPSIRALIFGTGGSSLAIRYALDRMGIEYMMVSRSYQKGSVVYEEINEEMTGNHLLWINCTPVGMFPDSANKLVLPYHHLTPRHFLYDLIYNPEVTAFLSMGLLYGAKIKNGSRMLYEQAEASWKIWME